MYVLVAVDAQVQVIQIRLLCPPFVMRSDM